MAAHRLPGRLSSALRVRRLNRENNQLTCKIVALARDLDEAGIELSGARQDHRDARADAKKARAEAAATVRLLTAARAELANERAITVRSWIRPIDNPVDEATQPTNVTSLQERGAA